MGRKAAVTIVLGSALALGTWVWAQQSPGQMGQGMMGQSGGSGQGMMGGQGPQSGTGPGMTSGGSPPPGSGVGPGMMGQPGGPGQGVQPGPGMGPWGMMGGGSRFDRPLISEILAAKGQLGLTADQERKLKTLRSGFEKQAIRRQAEIQAAEVDLRELLEASPVNLAKVNAQVKKSAALQAELRFARIRALEEGRTVLTSEQRRKFESLPRWPMPGGPWSGMGPGGQPGLGMGPSGMMGGGFGPGMMGGFGGPGMMGGGGPGWFGKRDFASNGERIYYTGISGKSGPIRFQGGPVWLAMHGGGCVACHGPSGRGGVPVMMGTAIPEDIRYDALTKEEHGKGKGEMEHPPYTDALIKRAITQGVDPAAKPLDWTMPRWQMSEQDQEDVLAYLKTLR